MQSTAAEVAPAREQAPAAPTRLNFDCFDGYRGIAALAVLVLHVSLLSGLVVREKSGVGPYLARADVGVAVFFLISGFLLYRPFVAARLQERPALSTAEFYKRRVLRIVPAYWVCLTVVAFWMRAPAFHGPQEPLPHYLLFHVYFLDQVAGGPVQQSWSLATEIAFYAALPLYVWLLGRGRRSPEKQVRLELVAVGLLIAASVVFKLVMLGVGTSPDRYGQMGTWLPFRLDAFGLGMLLAVVSAWHQVRPVRALRVFRRWWAPWTAWVLAALPFWAVSTQLGIPLAPTFTSRQALVVQELYIVSAFFLLLPGIFGTERRGVIRSFLRSPVMVWLGVISYGIYIWHEAWLQKYLDWTHRRPFFVPFWQVFGVVVGLTIVVSAASYYLVERPFLRLKSRRFAGSRRLVGERA